MRLPLILLATLCLVLSASLVAAQELSGTPAEICAAATPATEPDSREFTSAEFVLEEGVDYRAVFCTEAGPVYIDLLENYAPITVNSFVFLARNGYYNNITFHRVLADFMAQGGDPTGTGSGGPGYQFRDEFVGFLQFDRPGLLAMANAGPGTNGSQFFITTSEPTYLNFRHTIFGAVLDGYENVLNLRLRDPQANPDFLGATLETVVIVTDPASVATTYTSDAEVATQETFTTGLDVLFSDLPPDLAVTGTSGEFDADAIAGAAPSDAREALLSTLVANDHQWRVVRGVENAQCNTDYFFTSLTYTVDAFTSAEAARAVFDSAEWASATTSAGFGGGEPGAEVGVPVYSQATVVCNDEAGVSLRTFLLRGRYLVTVEALVPDGILTQVTSDVLLNDFVAQLFEQFLIEGFESEWR